jgi:hypothetical protein
LVRLGHGGTPDVRALLDGRIDHAAVSIRIAQVDRNAGP